jgi:hypothetical protein
LNSIEAIDHGFAKQFFTRKISGQESAANFPASTEVNRNDATSALFRESGKLVQHHHKLA